MMNLKKNQKGFTLVELLIVMVIIGILAAIAVPAFNTARQNAQKKVHRATLQQIASAVNSYYVDTANGVLPTASFTVEAKKADLSPYFKGGLPAHPFDEDWSSVTVSFDKEQITVTDAGTGTKAKNGNANMVYTEAKENK